MDGDERAPLRRGIEPGACGILPGRAGIGEGDGCGEPVRLHRAGAVIGAALSRAHDDDVRDGARAVERLDRPREHGATGNFHKLLAAGVAEPRARAARHDDGARLPQDHTAPPRLPPMR